MILYLFVNGKIFASDNRETLREIGDRHCEFGHADSYQIVPLDYVVDEAYFV